MPTFDFDLNEVGPEASDEQPVPEQRNINSTPEVIELSNTPPVINEKGEKVAAAEEDQTSSFDDIPENIPPQQEEADSQKPEANNLATGVYRLLTDRGYLPENTEFSGSMEDLEEVLTNKLPNSMFWNYVSKLPPKVQQLFNYTYKKGNAVQDKDIREFVDSMATLNLDSANLETADGQESFARQQLIKRGTAMEDADILIRNWKESGQLSARVNRLYKDVKDAEEKATSERMRKAEEEAAAQEKRQKEFVERTVNELKSTQWNPEKQRKVYSEIFDGHMNHKSRNIDRYPKALLQLADFMTYFDEKSGAFDVEAYHKGTFGKEVTKVKNKIEQYFDVPTRSGNGHPGGRKFDPSELEFAD